MSCLHVRRAAGLAAVLLLPSGPVGAVATAWSEHEPVAVRLVSDWAVAPATGGLDLGLHFRLAPGWHVYWKHSGDAGFPPVVEVAGEPAVGAVDLLFPAPERYDLRGGLVAYGYAEEVVYPLRISRPEGTADVQRLMVNVDYLACEEDCIPFRDELALELPVAPERRRDDDEAPLLASWRDRVPRDAEEAGVRLAAVLRSRPEPTLELSLEGPVPAGATPRLFLEPIEGWAASPAEPVEGDARRFRVALAAERAGASLPASLPLKWTAAGLGTAAAPLALSGTAVAEPPPPPLREPPPPAALTLAPAVDGALLALSPPSLAVLLLLALGPHRRERRRLGTESLVWPALFGAGAGVLTIAVVSRLFAGPDGPGAALSRPSALAVLALPALALALTTWAAPRQVLSSGDGAAGTAGWAFAAVALALPWAPLAPEAAAALAGLSSLPERLLAAGGFALPFAIAALVGTTDELRPEPRLGAAGAASLGFLPLLSLIWISYRMAGALPAHRLAFVQLAWIGAGLAARFASPGRGRALAVALAAAAAVASVWIAVGAP